MKIQLNENKDDEVIENDVCLDLNEEDTQTKTRCRDICLSSRRMH